MAGWWELAIGKIRRTDTQLQRSLAQFEGLRDDGRPITETFITEAVLNRPGGDLDAGRHVPAVLGLAGDALYIATGRRWPTAARLAFDALASYSLVPYQGGYRRLVLVGADHLTTLVQRGAEDGAPVETMAVTGRDMAQRQPGILFRHGDQRADHFLGALTRQLPGKAEPSPA